MYRLLFIAIFLLAPACSSHNGGASDKNGSPGHPAPPAGSGNPTDGDNSELWTTSPGCNGGSGLKFGGPFAETATEQSLMTAIVTYRTGLGLSALNGLPANAAIGIAQQFAADMNANDYVGLVDSTGEDILTRFACSYGAGPVPQNGGIIVVGQTTNVADIMNLLTSQAGPTAVLQLAGPATARLIVGQDNGFWVIIIY
jgi:hypothetical protein